MLSVVFQNRNKLFKWFYCYRCEHINYVVANCVFVLEFNKVSNVFFIFIKLLFSSCNICKYSQIFLSIVYYYLCWFNKFKIGLTGWHRNWCHVLYEMLGVCFFCCVITIWLPQVRLLKTAEVSGICLNSLWNSW